QLNKEARSSRVRCKRLFGGRATAQRSLPSRFRAARGNIWTQQPSKPPSETEASATGLLIRDQAYAWLLNFLTHPAFAEDLQTGDRPIFLAPECNRDQARRYDWCKYLARVDRHYQCAWPMKLRGQFHIIRDAR